MRQAIRLFRGSVALSVTVELMLCSEDAERLILGQMKSSSFSSYSTRRTITFSCHLGKLLLTNLEDITDHSPPHRQAQQSQLLFLWKEGLNPSRLSDRDNFPSLRQKSDPWAFEAFPDASQTEEQQQVSVHLFVRDCDGKDLDLLELGSSVHLCISVFFPST